MSTTWEDVQAEMAYDHMMEEVEGQLAEQKSETILTFITHGFESHEDVTSEILREKKSLNGELAQSLGLLNCVLMEAIERETICLPLLVAGLGVSENKTDRIQKLKKMISRGVNSAKFVCGFFEDQCSDLEQELEYFQDLIDTNLPNHEFFKSEKSLINYREKVTGCRNQLVHGRRFSTVNETQYIDLFAASWKDRIYNSILAPYGLRLNAEWMLVDI